MSGLTWAGVFSIHIHKRLDALGQVAPQVVKRLVHLEQVQQALCKA